MNTSKMRYCLVLLLLMVNASCKEQADQGELLKLEKNDRFSNISKNDIESIRYTEYGISPDTEKATENWLQYKELSGNIDQLKDGDLSYFSSDPNMLRISFNDLRMDIPKAVNTNPIKSRMLVLETKVLKLNSLLRINNVQKEELITAITETLVAMSHFNDQMNKKFEIENNNFDPSN